MTSKANIRRQGRISLRNLLIVFSWAALVVALFVTPLPSDIVALGTLALSLLSILVYWKRPWHGFILAIVVVMAGWISLMRANEADIQRELRRIESKQARGEQVSEGEELFDGTGDRVAVLFMGWLPGGVGVAVGSLVAFGLRRILKKAA